MVALGWKMEEVFWVGCGFVPLENKGVVEVG
jgi:hypothetical protein